MIFFRNTVLGQGRKAVGPPGGWRATLWKCRLGNAIIIIIIIIIIFIIIIIIVALCCLRFLDVDINTAQCHPESPNVAPYLVYICKKFTRSPYAALSCKQSRRGSGPE